MSVIRIPEEVKGIIFDCDGTLADTMPLHYKSWLAALGEHAPLFDEELFYACAGMPTRAIIELLNERFGVSIPVAETTVLKEDLFVPYLEEVAPIAQVEVVVKEYFGKMPLGVATGGIYENCLKTLEVLGLENCFAAIVTADDVEHGKPAPDIFLEAARRMGVAPQDCIVLEDGETGIVGAKAAGMRVIDVRPFVTQ